MKTYKVKSESSEVFMKEYSAEDEKRCSASVDDYMLIKKDACDFDILLASRNHYCRQIEIEEVTVYNRQDYDDFAYKFLYTKTEYYFEGKLIKTTNK